MNIRAGNSLVYIALAMVFLLAPLQGISEPRTLYKAADIATAQENIARYQWARTILDNWKQSAEYAMRQDRAFIEDMIAPLTPWPTYGQNCPACVGRLSTMGETGLYEWNVREPDILRCKYCGTVYPNSAYPETGSITCKRMGQTFTFYETPDERENPSDRTGKYAFRWASWPVHTSFSGVLRYNRAAWCIRQILPLAKLYALTGDTGYAAKAAMIMDIVATRYPNWLYHSYNGTYADCPPAEAAAELGRHPRAGRFPVETIVTAFPGLHTTKEGYATLNNGFWGAGRFGCSGSDGGLILDMTVAYDLIHEARMPDGSPVITSAMENRIVNNLIIAGCVDSEHWAEINNKCGPGRAMSAAVGILFNRPESVRRAMEGFDTLMDHSFHSDGFCVESPSYSAMHLDLMREIPEILAGYSDPPGYRDADGVRYDKFDPFTKIDRYRLALESMVRMLDFNNRFPVIGDTHFGSGINPVYAEILTAHYGAGYAGLLAEAQGAPLAEKGSEYALWRRPPGAGDAAAAPVPRRTEWFPGWHVGMLRGGINSGNTMFCFNGYAHGTHRHYDTLGIAYSAYGKELASDRGYIWDDPRNAWTKSTRSHNIVVVDGGSQRGEVRSTLDLFGSSPLVEVISASANAYEQCDRYHRTCALVNLPGGGTYAVDIFRVRGGKLHQYGLNCNGRLTGIMGADPQPSGEEMQWLENIRTAEPKDTFSVSWEYDGVKFDMIMLNPVDRLLVADAPGWRNNRGEHINAPPIQQVFAERRDDIGAESIFAVVLVPWQGASSPVKSVGGIHFDAETGTVAIAVERDGGIDYIVSAPEGGRKKYGPVETDGRFAFARVDGSGKPEGAYLLDGSFLSCGGNTLSTGTARSELRVESVDGRRIRLAEPLPQGFNVTGRYILAEGTGFEPVSASGQTIEVRDYPVPDCRTITVVNSSYFVKK